MINIDELNIASALTMMMPTKEWNRALPTDKLGWAVKYERPYLCAMYGFFTLPHTGAHALFILLHILQLLLHQMR